MILGFDIDGVITAGVHPYGEQTYIVTGRPHHDAKKTIEFLHELCIFNAVYFNPSHWRDITPESSGEWKAFMVYSLRIEEFFEDDPIQAEVIRRRNPNCIVHMVVNGQIMD